MTDPSQEPTLAPTADLDAAADRETLPVVGRYHVERLLGRGGFGEVYLGFDKELQRRVAIKLLRPPERPDPAAFLREARALACLDHPHIVPVYDVGVASDRRPYIVTKFIDGTDLARRLQGAPLAPADVAGFLAPVAEALHHAHAQGLVHRDVKPANILLDQAGKPYVTDFGLALWSDRGDPATGWAGTPAWMSPEQARGEGHRVDGRSDIFSLGVVLYRLLTGRLPFRATGPELLEQIATQEPRPPRQVDDRIPAELERICLRALAKRVSDRYTTAADLAADLRAFLQPRKATSEPDTGPPGLLHAIWDSLDPHLQDAFALAYTKKLREGSNRISTRDLFQALARVDDDAFQSLRAELPAGSLPEPVPQAIEPDPKLLRQEPLLSTCVEESLSHFADMAPLPRKLAPVDLFVDIGKHGHGPSVARLREHGVTPEELEKHVRRRGLSILRRARKPG